MSHPAYIQKTLVMKPEVTKIFDDLEAFHDFCRFELLPFDPANLYNRKSDVWNQYFNATRPRKPRNEKARKAHAQ